MQAGITQLVPSEETCLCRYSRGQPMLNNIATDTGVGQTAEGRTGSHSGLGS